MNIFSHSYNALIEVEIHNFSMWLEPTKEHGNVAKLARQRGFCFLQKWTKKPERVDFSEKKKRKEAIVD